MESSISKKLNYWLTDGYFDEASKKELESLRSNEDEIFDRFYKELEFGTGGLRGVIGAGDNRMNVYTVRKATQGLANYINKKTAEFRGNEKALSDYITGEGAIGDIHDEYVLESKTDAPSVAISFDCRRFSPEFADEAARCLAANGIRAYIVDSLRPTPELSFALRAYRCIAGIMITASHNPPEYNGYKAYWADGAQVTPPNDDGIIKEVRAIKDFSAVKTLSKEEAVNKGLYVVIGKELDDLYMKALKKQIIHRDIIEKQADKVKIVYTPFHGTGLVPVKRILSELGFKNVFVVPEQADPDPEFTTLEYPNPEDEKAFTYALKYAKEQGADIVMATDPDADRLGVFAYDKKSGEYKALTGNMSGMLIGEYVFRERKAKGLLPENPAFISTIVTTRMALPIAKEYGAKYIDVLTGFKYIGEQIKNFERTGSNSYIFGLEESYGCLAGTHARDKDAIVAVMLLCELTAFYKDKGKTVWDAMTDLYEKYGYYKEGQFSITMKGSEGAKEISALMDGLRNDPPGEFAGFKVEEFRDYKSKKARNFLSGESFDIELPPSNVLYFKLENEAWCCARPSGTEPKIKFYMGVKGESFEDAVKKEKLLTEAVRAVVS